MPSLTMEMDFLEDYGPLPQLNTPAPLTIDLNTTQVLDSSGENKQLYGYLRDVLALDDNGRVAIDLHETEIIDKTTNGTAKLDDIFIIQESTLSGTTMDYSQPAIRLPPPTADGTNVLMINGDEVEFVTTDQPAGARRSTSSSTRMEARWVQGRHFCKISHGPVTEANDGGQMDSGCDQASWGLDSQGQSRRGKPLAVHAGGAQEPDDQSTDRPGGCLKEMAHHRKGKK